MKYVRQSVTTDTARANEEMVIGVTVAHIALNSNPVTLFEISFTRYY